VGVPGILKEGPFLSCKKKGKKGEKKGGSQFVTKGGPKTPGNGTLAFPRERRMEKKRRLLGKQAKRRRVCSKRRWEENWGAEER